MTAWLDDWGGVQFWTGKGTVLFKAIVRGTLCSTITYSVGILFFFTFMGPCIVNVFFQV